MANLWASWQNTIIRFDTEWPWKVKNKVIHPIYYYLYLILHNMVTLKRILCISTITILWASGVVSLYFYGLSIYGLACISFQTAGLNFWNRIRSREHDVSLGGDHVTGFCFDGNKLYCAVRQSGLRVDELDYRSGLYMYEVMNKNAEIRLLDSFISRAGFPHRLCVNRRTHQVYVQSCYDLIEVYQCTENYNCLVKVKTLTCVAGACGVAVNGKDSVFIGDSVTGLVCLVDVTKDRVIKKLQKPVDLRSAPPRCISAMDGQVLVAYGRNDLMMYYSDLTPARVLHTPHGLETVSSITSYACPNQRRRFFLVTSGGCSLFVLDYRGKLYHTIQTGSPGPVDCAVFQSELWLGHRNGFTVMVRSS